MVNDGGNGHAHGARMVDAGILHEDDRVELLSGQVVTMAPIAKAHAAAVDQVAAALFEVARGRATVRVQGPLAIATDTQVQPDVAVIARGRVAPGTVREASSIHLVVEVADSSLAYDRSVKLAAYARAGIAETWLLNLVGTPPGAPVASGPRWGCDRPGPGKRTVKRPAGRPSSRSAPAGAGRLADWDRMQQLAAQSRWAEAIAVSERHLGRGSRDADFMRARATLERRAGNHAAAIRWAAAAERHVSHPDTLLILARGEMQVGRTDDAVRHAQAALALAPDNARALLLLAETFESAMRL
ncbi:MAG: tetratricopeptide repeat protein, partial [Proteobacteria bacterium]|nr:tetratricopeptide repeat protein [Pseudomonadota bacterium]